MTAGPIRPGAVSSVDQRQTLLALEVTIFMVSVGGGGFRPRLMTSVSYDLPEQTEGTWCLPPGRLAARTTGVAVATTAITTTAIAATAIAGTGRRGATIATAVAGASLGTTAEATEAAAATTTTILSVVTVGAAMAASSATATAATAAAVAGLAGNGLKEAGNFLVGFPE